MEHGLIQQSLPKPEFPGSSELDGLSLNISIPDTALREPSDQKLPVFVFIHGGGLSVGGNWYPQYDSAALVRLSVERGTPIVAVTINYRLGCPGFLTTPELRKAGYKANNGLRDQRAALTWIQQYIFGFGGDPENVTVAGQSAGGGNPGSSRAPVFLLTSNSVCWSHALLGPATGETSSTARWMPAITWKSAIASSRRNRTCRPPRCWSRRDQRR